MKVNEGAIDRGLRIVAGLVLIGLAATGTVGWWGWLGVVPLATVHLQADRADEFLQQPEVFRGTSGR